MEFYKQSIVCTDELDEATCPIGWPVTYIIIITRKHAKSDIESNDVGEPCRCCLLAHISTLEYKRIFKSKLKITFY